MILSKNHAVAGETVAPENLIDQLQNENVTLKKRVEHLENLVHLYQEQEALKNLRIYGSSSERTTGEQISFFNDTEHLSDPESSTDEYEEVTVKRRVSDRKKTRAIDFENLPKERVEYPLALEQIHCRCGCERHIVREDIRSELMYTPARHFVKQHVTFVYACRACDKTGDEVPMIKAPSPVAVIPKSFVSAELLAYVITQRYVESMPLYRQEVAYNRIGLYLCRQTLANWIVRASELYIVQLYNRMKQWLPQMQAIHVDETETQVIKESGRKATTTSYMWVFLSGHLEQKRIILFEYQQTRSHAGPLEFLKGFQGTIHCDGYKGYDKLATKMPTITLSGCWAHVRRKYIEALKALPENAKLSDTVAHEGKVFCDRLFALERNFEAMDATKRYQSRIEKSKPILDEMAEWLKPNSETVLPKGVLGKAITYTLNQWPKLLSFLKDGHLEISNNRAERAIRPFVIGRKNSLFSFTPRGANASAMMYSLVETAKANGLIPYEYFRYLFSQMSQAKNMANEQLDELLPWSKTIPVHCKVIEKPT